MTALDRPCPPPHQPVTGFLLSEEMLGVHDTVQKYYKYELAVPLRLLPWSAVKHRLARDVSQTPVAAHEQGGPCVSTRAIKKKPAG